MLAFVAFTEREQARIKYFMGYPDWVSLSQSFQLGYPAATQPLFLVEDAFKRLTPDGEIATREALCQCEDVENQMKGARRRLAATKLGELETNPNELRMLKRELLWWVTRVADCLGVVSNPYSQLIYQQLMGAGGVSSRVVG